MPVPPLGQCILHARESAVALGTEQADRHRQVVDDVQHRDRQDEAQVKPVRDIDMRLAAAQDRAAEDDKIGDPDDGQPDIDIPFRLGIFARLGDAHDIAGRGQHDEQLVSPEHEPSQRGKGQPRAAGALHDIKARRDQRVAAKGKDHRRCVQRPQSPEAGIFNAKVQGGKGQLQGDVEPCQKSRQPPEDGRDHAPADRIVIIFPLIGRHLQQAARDTGIIGPADRHHHHQQRRRAGYGHMDGKAAVHRHQRRQQGDHRQREPAARFQ